MARKVAGQRGSGVPNPVDVHVGARMRQRRTLLGMSQEKLAETLGITFQQVQKYERGVNRISASRLYDLCSILGCDANYFFEDMANEVAARSPKGLRGLSEAQAAFEPPASPPFEPPVETPVESVVEPAAEPAWAPGCSWGGRRVSCLTSNWKLAGRIGARRRVL